MILRSIFLFCLMVWVQGSVFAGKRPAFTGMETRQSSAAQSVSQKSDSLTATKNEAVIVFRDNAFKQIALAYADTDQDGEVTEMEALAVGTLSIYDETVQDLWGIQYFTNLQVLQVGGGAALTTIPSLAGLTQMHFLEITNSGLPELPLLPVSLETLWLFNNERLAIPENIAGLTNLIVLDIRENPHWGRLPALPEGLYELYCAGNGLTELTDLPENLGQLHAADNLLTDVSAIHGLAGLWRLDLSNNQLTRLDGLGPLPQMEVLSLQGNRLTSLANIPSNTKVLDISRNMLSSLSGATLSKLETLSAGDNQLTNADALVELTALDAASLDHNLLEALPKLSRLSRLRSLGLSHNNLRTLPDLDHLGNLKSLNLAWNQLTELPLLPGGRQLSSLHVEGNYFTCQQLQPLGLANWNTITPSVPRTLYYTPQRDGVELDCDPSAWVGFDFVYAQRHGDELSLTWYGGALVNGEPERYELHLNSGETRELLAETRSSRIVFQEAGDLDENAITITARNGAGDLVANHSFRWPNQAYSSTEYVYHIPHVFENPWWYTGLRLENPNPFDVEAGVYLYDERGERLGDIAMVVVPAEGKLVNEQIIPWRRLAGAARLQISCSNRLEVFHRFGLKGNQVYTEMKAPTGSARWGYFPVLRRHEREFTTVVFSNLNDDVNGFVKLNGYNQAGELVAEAELKIEPGFKQGCRMETLFGDSWRDEVATVFWQSQRDMTSMVLWGDDDGWSGVGGIGPDAAPTFAGEFDSVRANDELVLYGARGGESLVKIEVESEAGPREYERILKANGRLIIPAGELEITNEVPRIRIISDVPIMMLLINARETADGLRTELRTPNP